MSINRNAPGHRTEGAVCLLLAGWDNDAYSTGGDRFQASRRRHAIIVEQAPSGAFRVNIRPILSRSELERSFPLAWQAHEYAELLATEFGWPLIDMAEVAHG